MKRKVVATMLVAAMTMGLAACGSSASSTATTAAAKEETTAAAKETTAAAGETTAAAGAESKAADTKAAAETNAEGAVTGSKEGQTVLKCSFNQSADNPEAEAVREMSDALYDATEGRYSIEVYPNELLGNQQDSLASVSAGAVDMALVANSLLEGVNPDFAVLGTPYMFENIDQQEELFTNGNDAVKKLYSTTESKGFKVLAAYCLGPRNIYTKDGPVTKPEDLKGKKIRVMQSDTMIAMMKDLGGVGTPMSQGDVYSAIQTGTLDGAENNIITYMDLKQNEVGPYYSKTQHLMIPDEVIISSTVLNTMSADDQAALEKVATDSVKTAYSLCADLRDKYEEDAKAAGVTITDVDITPFKDACQELIEKNANMSDDTKAVYAEIQKIQNK
ncbi:TRAP transporter substrate-binding protein [Oribacterium sp. HCP28S3_H8]|jgi:tripartite ATP-independent transporter DctP family solute receptor|uniref:TRAP transporter substrate-binding protein n=1 Tax=Oribacterium sp. HCP28S3_H8 TaxID=3438945 RepID=UPI003066B689|nr:TRAP transporter substrate-binding protein [Oribacterium sp.]